MPRILGVDIPNNKKVEISLRYIYGIGPRRATEICDALGFDPAMRAQNLSEEQLNRSAPAFPALDTSGVAPLRGTTQIVLGGNFEGCTINIHQ